MTAEPLEDHLMRANQSHVSHGVCEVQFLDPNVDFNPEYRRHPISRVLTS